MSQGVFGITRPANITSSDVELWYNYKDKRSSNDHEFKKLEPSDKYLKPSNNGELIGMYNLSLPLETFGNVGVYTIYIKPKEIECKISKIGALSAFPDVRGIVLDPSNTKDTLPDDLTGYRVEYMDGVRRASFFRIVTSCGNVESMTPNLTSSYSDSIGYRYNNTGSLKFLTVTPSSTAEFNSNNMPFIGKPDQTIYIINTKFNPVALEVEIVEHDAETISYMLEGNQVRALDKGLVTTFNFKNEIYKQHEHYTLKDSYTGNPVLEIRKDKKDNIDFTQNSDILNE